MRRLFLVHQRHVIISQNGMLTDVVGPKGLGTCPVFSIATGRVYGGTLTRVFPRSCYWRETRSQPTPGQVDHPYSHRLEACNEALLLAGYNRN